MADWTEHAEVFAIPDVTAECDAMRPATMWRMVQFGKACRQECDKVRNKRRADWPQIVAIMHKLCKTGLIRNEEQYKHEFDDVYAIKSRRGIRALGILESRGNDTKPVFVVLSWFRKQRKSLSQQQIQRVQDRRRSFETFITEQCDEG
jgi:hypothetical protein